MPVEEEKQEDEEEEDEEKQCRFLESPHPQVAQAPDRRPRADAGAAAQLGAAGRNHRRLPRGKRAAGRGSGRGPRGRYGSGFHGGEHAVAGGHDQGGGGAGA